MQRPRDLHGSAPDDHHLALLVVDVINDLEFDDGERLLIQARPMAEALERLIRRARSAGVPVIYVNDNFGRWRSDFRRLIRHCLEDGVRGEEIVRRLAPEPDDYFVLKPKNSGFFATTLDILLQHLGATQLIVTGMAADNCVLFTAADAHMRDFEVTVPRDCVASNTKRAATSALELMERMLSVRVVDGSSIRMPKKRRQPRSSSK